MSELSLHVQPKFFPFVCMNYDIIFHFLIAYCFNMKSLPHSVKKDEHCLVTEQTFNMLFLPHCSVCGTLPYLASSAQILH